MEISTKLQQAENTEYRSGTASRSAQNVEKVLKELVQGARFQGTVLERQGQLELIDVGGAVVRAKSAFSLPQGAQVELEVVEDGSPLQVRLLSLVESEASSKAREATAINREMLGVRAGMSKLTTLFAGSLAGKEISTPDGAAGEKTVKNLITALRHGESPDASAARASFTLFQQGAGSSSSLLKDIVLVLKAFSRPEPEGQAPRDSFVQDKGGGGAGQDGARQTGQVVRGSMAGGAGMKDAVSAGSSSGVQSGFGGVTSENGSDAVSRMRTTTDGAGHSSGLKTDPSDAVKTAMQPRGAESLKSSTQGDADIAHGSRAAQEQKSGTTAGAATASSRESEMPGQRSGPGGFVSLASRVARHGNESAKGQGRGVTGGQNIQGGQSAQKENVTYRPSDFMNREQAFAGGKIPYDAISKPAGEKHAGDVILNKMAAPPVSSRTKAELEVQETGGRLQPEATKGRLVEASTSQKLEGKTHEVLHGTAHQPRKAASGREPVFQFDQPSQSQHARDPAGQASSRQDSIHRFMSALATHTDSVQHYQQQVQNYLDAPFYMIPLWFENGAGHGHWSWWKEEGEQHETDQGEAQHLVFDLELTALGRVNIHLLQDAQGITLYAAASRNVLPVLRDGIGELRERMNAQGLNFAVADIFALDEPGSEDLFTPVPRPSSSDSALDIRA